MTEVVLRREEPQDYHGNRVAKRMRPDAPVNTFYQHITNPEITTTTRIAPVAGTTWTHEFPQRSVLFETTSRKLNGSVQDRDRYILNPEQVNLLLYNEAIERMLAYHRKHGKLDEKFEWFDDEIATKWKLKCTVKQPPNPDAINLKHMARYIGCTVQATGLVQNYWGRAACGGKYLHFAVKYVNIGLLADEIFFRTAMSQAIPKADSSFLKAKSRKYAMVPQIFAIVSSNSTLTIKERLYTINGESYEMNNVQRFGRCDHNPEYSRADRNNTVVPLRDIAIPMSCERIQAAYSAI